MRPSALPHSPSWRASPRHLAQTSTVASSSSLSRPSLLTSAHSVPSAPVPVLGADAGAAASHYPPPLPQRGYGAVSPSSLSSLGLGLPPSLPSSSSREAATPSATGSGRVQFVESPYQLQDDDKNPRRRARAKAAAAAASAAAPVPAPLQRYMLGQLASVTFTGLWWAMLGVFVLSMFGGSPWGIAAVRAAFNLAVLLASPAAAAVAARVPVRSLLLRAAVARGAVYALLLPGLWFVLESGLVLSDPSRGARAGFRALALLLFAADGVAVSYVNACDIDNGGTAAVAAQYGVDEAGDAAAARFQALHEWAFEGGAVLLAPLVAAAVLLISPRVQMHPSEYGSTGVVCAVASAAALFSVAAVWQYSRMPEPEAAATGGAAVEAAVIRGRRSRGYGAQLARSLGEAADGLKVCVKTPGLRWRIAFYALDHSLDDAMVTLAVPALAVLGLEGGEDGDFIHANMWAAGLLAAGKLGAVGATAALRCWWEARERAALADEAAAGGADEYVSVGDGSSNSSSFGSGGGGGGGGGGPGPSGDAAAALRRYRPLFWTAAVAGVCALGVPAAYVMFRHHRASGHPRAGDETALVLIFSSSFAYFAAAAPPRVGFAALLHEMAVATGSPGRVYAFVAPLTGVVHALVVLALAAVFACTSVRGGLWAVAGSVAVMGIVQALTGPRTVRDSARAAAAAWRDSLPGVQSPAPGSMATPDSPLRDVREPVMRHDDFTLASSFAGNDASRDLLVAVGSHVEDYEFE